MLSYKNWKIVSEAFGAAIPLGISRPNAIGVVGSKLQNERHRIGDGKKSWDLRDIDLEDEEDVGLEDEEDVDMDMDMDMGDEDMDDVDMDDEDMDDEFDHPHGVHHDDDEEDFDDEDVDMDMDDEEDFDDEDVDMDMDMDDEDAKSPLLMMKRYITKYMKKEACHNNSGDKKKMLYSKKNLKKENYELRKENIELHEILATVAEGGMGAAGGAGVGALLGGPIGAMAGGALGSSMQSKKQKKGQSKKQNKKMKKESNEFLKSLTDQGKGTVHQKWSSGLTEDALFALENPNAGWEADSNDETEVGPGEVGYAPQGRIGEIGGSEMPDLPTLGDDS